MHAVMKPVDIKQLAGARLRVRGQVQGVGFRPMVWKLAQQHCLRGMVRNDADGVLIKVWGEESSLCAFIKQLPTHCPPLARIDSLETTHMPIEGAEIPADFSIVHSEHGDAHTGVVPDAATCAHCLTDISDTNNRRYRYAFTNCTHCGPRLSIIRRIPYDRANTSMAVFELCPRCASEYHDPTDRRFHAQPTACPDCGPGLWLSTGSVKHSNESLAKTGQDDIARAATLLRQGAILAIKGLGGYHLACDATNAEAIQRLRQRKKRPAKPFALMATNLAMIENYCYVSTSEAELLQSTAAPVVLLKMRHTDRLPQAIAPAQHNLGFMLPYSPLHHLLLREMARPLVMTSGNIGGNPQCIDNDQAERELAGIADGFLHHNRDILNRVDDSVARVIDGRMRMLRRARGYAPASLPLPQGFAHNVEVLAFGAELKNTFCLLKDGQAVLSQHMGGLENAATLCDYEHNLALYQQLFSHRPLLLAVDAHPEYLSGKLGRQRAEEAEEQALTLIEVQHHHAHIASCLAENNWPLQQDDNRQVLGVCLDGLGYGDDGDLWGGEFLLTNYRHCQRVGSLQAVAMPGGAQAMRQPWRNTWAQLRQLAPWVQLQGQYHDLPLMRFLADKPLDTLDSMVHKGVNAPLASSCGRLFDAVAAAVGICREQAQYEGQAAIELEALVTTELLAQQHAHAYPFAIIANQKHIMANSQPLPRLHSNKMWRALLSDLQQDTDIAVIAARFHLGLSVGIVDMVEHINRLTATGNGAAFQEVALSGGVFQNRVLFEQVSRQLEAAGYHVLSHSQVPTNDGGISLGQAVIALAKQMQANSNSQRASFPDRPEKRICV